MSETQTTEAALPDDSAVTETTRCAGYCDRHVHEAATVDVVVGARIGEWSDPNPHVGVTGLGRGTPVVEQWCVTCAEEEFGVETEASGYREEAVRRYLTAKTVSAFALGTVLTALTFVLFYV